MKSHSGGAATLYGTQTKLVMNKKKFIVGTVASGMLLLAGIGAYCCLARPDSILGQNVQALAEQESGGIFGYCAEKEEGCFYACPNCGALYEAVGHGGGSYDMGGTCVKCKKRAEDNK